ncbi:hypothetical protein IE53DRAFT_366716 [Violaceomyces palustris]|uniref:Uncharacterized protein n=1 Tax=Violaceomyces palustris TaxID=1673888 RepID=A0ACD0P4G0_9BASI|nr:hypothetical protein IE53DRAFT_366716 [Violaceomyces palustris]
MGASESRPRLSNTDDAPRQGYHVVRVAAGSPAHLAGIEPFFDFCVGIDGVALDPSRDIDGHPSTNDRQSSSLSAGLGAWKSLEEREGTQVILNVWSSKTQQLRDSNSTGAVASSTAFDKSQPSLLGLSLRLCDPSHALTHVWHILEILEGSPAESAGLVPFGDFVIGWTGGVLKGEGDFYELVEAHADRALRLYVYNSDYDHTREVIIVPNREWGGEGLLGCGVGYGLLHRIPKPQDRAPLPLDVEEVESYQDTQNDRSTNSNEGNFFNHYGLDGSSGGGPQANTHGYGSNGVRAGYAEGGDEDEDDAEANTSGVTVSVRRDEEEEDEE